MSLEPKEKYWYYLPDLDLIRYECQTRGPPVCVIRSHICKLNIYYSVILSVLDPRKCEYLKDYSLYFEHAYMTIYIAS